LLPRLGSKWVTNKLICRIPEISEAPSARYDAGHQRRKMRFLSMSSVQDKVYSSTDYHKRKHGASAGASALITRYRTEKFRAFTKSPTLEVLEVGVGPGWNLVCLPARRRVGQDVTFAYANHLEEHGVEFVSDLSQLSGQQFDVVILAHVMEHLLEPAKMLMDLAALLKADGELVVIVPLESATRKFFPHDANHHLFSWNVHTLNEFLSACGYAVRSCEVKRYGYDRFAAELAVRFRGGFGLYKLLLSFLRVIRPGYEIQTVVALK
jgi:2-polyprenyl-3-methyl-5-hydroxy-6-metoxy-1,4-benzoquinol methylase